MAKQVTKEHYSNNYDSVERFISYFYQCKLILDLNIKNALEIGVGNKLTSNYLSNNGIKVTTFDVDNELKPDFTGDVRQLHFKNNSFDCVYAYQVLEHIPFSDFEKALNELFRVSRKYVVISLPCYSLNFEFVLKLPLVNKLFKKGYLDLFFRIPYFFKKYRFDGQHYWELGSYGCSFSIVRKILKKKFKIIKEIRPVLNGYHYFFVLEKI